MAHKSNDGSHQPRKSKKERVWTNAEMKYLALELAEEKKQFVVRLETLALKKSSNNQVFEEISKDFEKLLLSDEFKEENERASLLDLLSRKSVQKTRPIKNTGRVTRHTDSSSHSPSRIYTRRMILLDG